MNDRMVWSGQCDDPDAFVNDVWDAKTPNPYREGKSE